MTHKLSILVRTDFIAFHKWEGAKSVPGAEFLSNKHRHKFYVEIKIPVEHNNRDVEFTIFKKNFNEFIRGRYEQKDLREMSCEMICEQIVAFFPYISNIKVWEDNENGAELERV